MQAKNIIKGNPHIKGKPHIKEYPQLEEYPYLYETHFHTSRSSKCAISSGEEMVRAYKAGGYSGIIVTDHSWYGNTAVDRALPWEEWVREFCKGYEEARECGEKIGLDVFFGYEANYRGTEFLIYGVDKEWLLSHPQIKKATIEEQYKLIGQAGGMVIHAHPFRKANYIPKIRLYPEWVDGVEGLNAKHSSPKGDGGHEGENEQAIAYARKHDLPMSAGSDNHNTKLLGGGVATRKKLSCIGDYVELIKGQGDYLLTDGGKWYTKEGESFAENL